MPRVVFWPWQWGAHTYHHTRMSLLPDSRAKSIRGTAGWNGSYSCAYSEKARPQPRFDYHGQVFVAGTHELMPCTPQAQRLTPQAVTIVVSS